MKIKIQVNHGLANHKAGSIVEVAAHDDQTPEDPFWRRRLSDAVIDGCCEIVKDKPKKVAERKASESNGVKHDG